MATLGPLSPDGDGSIGAKAEHDAGTGAPFYTHIDEDPASAGSDWVANDQSESDTDYFAEVASMPADFASMDDALKVDVSVQANGFSNDSCVLYAQVFASNETTTYTDEVQVGSEADSTKTTRQVSFTLIGSGSSADEAAWNGARIKFRWDYTKTAGPDNGQVQLFAFELNGSYVQESISGSLSETLGAATLSAAGDVLLDGALGETLGAAALSGAGGLLIDGVLSEALDPATLSAAGTVAYPPIEGTLTETLDALSLSAVGVMLIEGALSETLDAASLSSLGDLLLDGGLLSTLDETALAGAGLLPIDGAVARTLDETALSAAGELSIVGTATPTLGDDSLAAAGDIPLEAVFSATLDEADLASSAQLLVDGSLSTELDESSLAAGASVDIAGSLSLGLDSVGLTAAGMLTIVGGATISLDEAALTGSALLPIVAVFSGQLDDVLLSAVADLVQNVTISLSAELARGWTGTTDVEREAAFDASLERRHTEEVEVRTVIGVEVRK